MYKYLLLFTIDFNSNNEKIYIFVVKKKKKNKNRNLQFKNELSKEVKIAVYSLIKKKEISRKKKTIPDSLQTTNSSSSKFPKNSKKRKTYTRTRTSPQPRRDYYRSKRLAKSSLRRKKSDRAGGKGSGRKIKWCNGKKVRQRERREREHGGGLSGRYVRARAGEEEGEGDKWRMVGEMIRGRCCVLGFGRNSRVWGRTYGPRPIYRRRTGGSSFCPSVNRLSCTTNGLPYPQRGERRRTVNWGCGPRWGREDARGGGYTSLPGMITQQPLISSCR